jgi:hypothetical protein
MASETKAPAPRRKTAAQTATKSPASAPKKTAAKAEDKPAARAPRKTKATSMPITADARLRHIEVAAYYIAEKRGFGEGDPADDWRLAEQQVDGLLLAGKLPG